MPEMKTVTVRELLANVRKNGLPKAKHSYFRETSSKIGRNILFSSDEHSPNLSACALGQAYINIMGHTPGVPKFSASIYATNYTRISEAISQIAILNDNTDLTLSEIADQVEVLYSDVLDTKVTVSNG